jgi:hypothetical protein
MNYHRRSYAGIADQALMRALVEAAPDAHLHVVDVPRVRVSCACSSA